MARQRGERHRKGFAARAQGIDGTLHGGCLAGIEPAAEGEHAMRSRHADGGGIAVDRRLVGARRPIHHDLRLGQNERVGAIDFVAQPRDLVARPGLQSRRAHARAHQHDRGHDGEQNDAADQREKRDLVPVDAAMRGQDELFERQRRLLGGGRRNRVEGRKESANSPQEPRTRIAPARPDRLRHAPSPLLAAAIWPADPPRRRPANRTTLLSSGIAPKESRS